VRFRLELTYFLFWRVFGNWYWKINAMLRRFIFKRMSLQQKVSFLKKKGVILGTRVKDGRKIFIYMLEDLFLEVTYKEDNSDNEPEGITVLRGLENLNNYLEREFKASF
jgi:hypothetical protein